jgi:ketosteroid isomerase-like protein
MEGNVSRSNVELLAQGYAGRGKGTPANMRDVLHPECELVAPDSVPCGGTFRGAEAAIAWFTRELRRWFDEFNSTSEASSTAATRSSSRSTSKRGPRTARPWTCITSGYTNSARAG